MSKKRKTINKRVYKFEVFDKLNFGKYKGMVVSDVIKHNPKYLQWCFENLKNIEFSESIIKCLWDKGINLNSVINKIDYSLVPGESEKWYRTVEQEEISSFFLTTTLHKGKNQLYSHEYVAGTQKVRMSYVKNKLDNLVPFQPIVKTFCKDPITNVYMVKLQDTNFVKIGKSTNIQKRIYSLESGSPNRVDLLLNVDNVPEQFEKWLHYKFFAENKKGEWFEYRDKIVDFHNEPVKYLQEFFTSTWT